MHRYERNSFIAVNARKGQLDRRKGREVHMNAIHEQIRDVMQTLFRRNPELCGFLVQQDLSCSHVACHPALDGEETRELIDEISAALHELLEEEPEAAELLRGRTLARSFH